VTLAYTVQRLPDQITVVFAGEADPTAADQFHTALLDAATGPHTQVVVDLRGLVFIDSGSIGLLMAARHAARRHGNTLRIAHPRGQVLRVLQVAGVLAVLSTTRPTGAGTATG
jgi:anti-sigma B factor antagonist